MGKSWWGIALWLGLCLGSTGYAQVKVAFLEILDSDGKPMILEPGGRWAHAAISYRGGWIHSISDRPVEWISTEELSHLGRIGEILTLPGIPEPTPQMVAKELGKPFDFNFDWESPYSSFCSKLVGKLVQASAESVRAPLEIIPLPVSFSTPIWRLHARANDSEGKSLSPDDLYRIFNNYLSRTLKKFQKSLPSACEANLLLLQPPTSQMVH